ncbi:MAG TPA: hypothetical protein ENI97_15780 [Gammaproteobacteria bacterium]|nr:hypothetical protein [Gammaproteobacteria bacterium]
MLFAPRGQARSLPQWFAVVLASLLLGACATQGDIMDKLNTTLRGYEQAVRWGQFDAVYSFHRWPDEQEPSLPANMENIRITKYAASGQRLDPKKMIMKQTVTLSYYNTDDQRVRSIKHRHEWKYFPKLKRWYLISDPITFP